MKEENYLTKNRKVIDYHNLTDQDTCEEEVMEDSKKFTNLKKNIVNSFGFNWVINKIYEFYEDTINTKEENIRNTFFVMILLFWFEHILISLSVRKSFNNF
jgi:hypothetical protein